MSIVLSRSIQMKWSLPGPGLSQPHLIPNPTRSFDHNWDFPKAFWKESRRLLIAAVLSLTASWATEKLPDHLPYITMESNTSLFMASPDDTTVQRDWKPSSIYQLYGSRCEHRRPKIIVHIYLKVVGLKERKAQYTYTVVYQYLGYTNTTNTSSSSLLDHLIQRTSVLQSDLFLTFLYAE